MAKDDNISTASGSLGTELIATTQTSFPNIPLPSPNLAHQLPVKLTSSIFLLWKTQFLSMVRGCRLGHHIDETTRNTWSKFVAAYASGSKPQIRELKI
ncbi:hypothetical protein KY284_027010 [Solanum tuberosum]|nr:hypothetical protein KY284_027010 [Solanum tuberosum]